MDLVAHRVTRAGKPVHLGPTEFRLLRHFMEHPGRVFSREQLLDAVWGKDVYVEARTVDVHIRRLRMALNGEQHADLIRTVRAAGYALDATPGCVTTGAARRPDAECFPHRQSRFCSLGPLHPACLVPGRQPHAPLRNGSVPPARLTPRRRSYCPSFLAEGGVSFSKCRRTITASTKAGRPSSAV